MQRRIEAETLRSILAKIIAERQQQQTRKPCDHCVVPTACLHCSDRPEPEPPEPTPELKKIWQTEDVQIAKQRQKEIIEQEKSEARLERARRKARGESPIY